MDLLNKSLTPVRFDNQPVKTPVKHDAIVATCRARLEKIITDLQCHHAKWQLAQQRGTSLCYTIEAMKTRWLENGVGRAGHYPDELKMVCEKLAIITTIFVDIFNNTREILRQLRALYALAGVASNLIFYRTWKLEQFISFTEELLIRYKQETRAKHQVMRNIAHCTKKGELIAYTTTWEFPEHVDTFVDLVFLLLTEELKT